MSVLVILVHYVALKGAMLIKLKKKKIYSKSWRPMTFIHNFPPVRKGCFGGKNERQFPGILVCMGRGEQPENSSAN
jgi:hypothetical protein